MNKCFFSTILALLLMVNCKKSSSSAKDVTFRKIEVQKTNTRHKSHYDFQCDLISLGDCLNQVKQESDLAICLRLECGKDTDLDSFKNFQRDGICREDVLKECLFEDYPFFYIPQDVIKTHFKPLLTIKEAKAQNHPCAIYKIPHLSDSEDLPPQILPATADLCYMLYSENCSDVIDLKNYAEICSFNSQSHDTFDFKLEKAKEGSRALRRFSTNDLRKGVRQPSDCIFVERTLKKEGEPDQSSSACLKVEDGIAWVRNIWNLGKQGKKLADGIANGVKKSLGGLEKEAKKHGEIWFGTHAGSIEIRKRGRLLGLEVILPTRGDCRRVRNKEHAFLFDSPEEISNFLVMNEEKQKKAFDQIPTFSLFLIKEKMQMTVLNEKNMEIWKVNIRAFPKDYKGKLEKFTDKWVIAPDLKTERFSEKTCEAFLKK